MPGCAVCLPQPSGIWDFHQALFPPGKIPNNPKPFPTTLPAENPSPPPSSSFFGAVAFCHGTSLGLAAAFVPAPAFTAQIKNIKITCLSQSVQGEAVLLEAAALFGCGEMGRGLRWSSCCSAFPKSHQALLLPSSSLEKDWDRGSASFIGTL